MYKGCSVEKMDCVEKIDYIEKMDYVKKMDYVEKMDRLLTNYKRETHIVFRIYMDYHAGFLIWLVLRANLNFALGNIILFTIENRVVEMFNKSTNGMTQRWKISVIKHNYDRFVTVLATDYAWITVTRSFK